MERQELIMLMAAAIAAPALHDHRDSASQHKNIFDRAVKIASAACKRSLGPEAKR